MNSEPLWSDIRVSKEAVEATDELDGSVYVHHVILQLLLKMRADYEAQLANQYQRIEGFVELVDQLETQLAQRWEPLPDGQYERPNRNHKGTNTLSVFANGAELETWHSDDKYQVDEISLPDNIRLCRLVTQEPTL